VVELVLPLDVLPRKGAHFGHHRVLISEGLHAEAPVAVLLLGAGPLAAGRQAPQHDHEGEGSHLASFFLRNSARLILCFFSYSLSFSMRAMSSWMRFTSLKM